MFLFYFILLFMDKRTDGRIGVWCGDFVVDGRMNVDALVVHIPCSNQTIVINLYATNRPFGIAVQFVFCKISKNKILKKLSMVCTF